MHFRMICLLAATALVGAVPAAAADAAFSYKTSYRNVTQDPDKVWTGDALAPNPKGTVTIHELFKEVNTIGVVSHLFYHAPTEQWAFDQRHLGVNSSHHQDQDHY